jgi:hypothetical protein
MFLNIEDLVKQHFLMGTASERCFFSRSSQKKMFPHRVQPVKNVSSIGKGRG